MNWDQATRTWAQMAARAAKAWSAATDDSAEHAGGFGERARAIAPTKLDEMREATRLREELVGIQGELGRLTARVDSLSRAANDRTKAKIEVVP